MKISEEFLYFIWQFQFFRKNGLRTSQGEKITILHPGYRNPNAGPDFHESRIRIGEIEWIGYVEIHVRSTDWYLHGHNTDLNFDNVILHIVWDDDTLVKRSDGTYIPTISLCKRVNNGTMERYKRLTNNKNGIACKNQWKILNPVTIYSQFERCITERMKRKSDEILDMLSRTNNDWEQVTFIILARYFGFKINNEPFTRLGKNLSLKTLWRYCDDLDHMEALIFGHAGYLDEDLDDPYYNTLKNIFLFLRKKYSIPQPLLKKHHWRYLRLRPSNFPAIRLAQFAAMIFNVNNLFSTFTTVTDIEKLIRDLTVTQSSYWRRHYDFGVKTDKVIPGLGTDSVQSLVINVVVPILFAYGEFINEGYLKERAIAILINLKFEDNIITRKWSGLNINKLSAFESQSMIELYHEYCLKKKCLNCNIGMALMKPDTH